ncbi:uncharacterized protein SPSK_03651 [Sporothrix schenckii 1099-18]|uniref:Uncharacterized protein n=1 Tax=Sporothrix schenckii 1099-18 TaxID=1397361 RepID=A0A0F2M0Y9_SPOSC|nr:uncharacterized protein SPSK_03651 [Sporothrix schenckii 1099-18]KJR82420.1 hypothetical protein SPSK_03651 [Sporothrix schenckii 1099-18]
MLCVQRSFARTLQCAVLTYPLSLSGRLQLSTTRHAATAGVTAAPKWPMQMRRKAQEGVLGQTLPHVSGPQIQDSHVHVACVLLYIACRIFVPNEVHPGVASRDGKVRPVPFTILNMVLENRAPFICRARNDVRRILYMYVVLPYSHKVRSDPSLRRTYPSKGRHYEMLPKRCDSTTAHRSGPQPKKQGPKASHGSK